MNRNEIMIETLKGNIVCKCPECDTFIVRKSKSGVRFIRCPNCDKMSITFED